MGGGGGGAGAPTQTSGGADGGDTVSLSIFLAGIDQSNATANGGTGAGYNSGPHKWHGEDGDASVHAPLVARVEPLPLQQGALGHLDQVEAVVLVESQAGMRRQPKVVKALAVDMVH